MSRRSLPSLSDGQLETLLAALDPRLEGFGEGGSELDDAAAYLARLGLTGDDEQGRESPLTTWLSRWSATGANRESLALAVATLIADRQARRSAQSLQLVWGATGESPLADLPALLATVERRLLLVFEAADTYLPLREAIQVRRHQVPDLQLLVACGPARPAWPDAADEELDAHGDGLRLLVCDDLVRWVPAGGRNGMSGLEPDLQLRSEAQAEGIWLQVQRLLELGSLEPLDPWGSPSSGKDGVGLVEPSLPA